MEILIKRQQIPLLRKEKFQQVEVVRKGEELRIYLYNGTAKTIFLMIEPAVEEDLAQIRQWLGFLYIMSFKAL